MYTILQLPWEYGTMLLVILEAAATVASRSQGLGARGIDVLEPWSI